MRLLVISRTFSIVPDNLSPPVEVVSMAGPGSITSPAQFEDVDAVAVLGSLENDQQAQQLAGALTLGLPRGLCVVVATGALMSDADKTFITQLVPGLQVVHADRPHKLRDPDPVFSDYVTVFGYGQTYFHSYPDKIDALGWLDEGTYPGAFFYPVGDGGLYVLPFQYVDDHHPMLSSLFGAISAHWSAVSAKPPAFLSELRLSGEEELRAEIAQVANRLQQLEDDLTSLREFHHLLGSASGRRFEQLCIRTMNTILHGTGYVAEDRPETHDEDFWIVANDADIALVEAKGVGSNVRREHVNQVDNHRETHGKSPQELPGVLIVNTFRNSDDLASRRKELSADVIAAAVRQNVLVMRSWDLHQLLGRHLSGEEVAWEFAKSLDAGGGWLHVAQNQLERIS